MSCTPKNSAGAQPAAGATASPGDPSKNAAVGNQPRTPGPSPSGPGASSTPAPPAAGHAAPSAPPPPAAGQGAPLPPGEHRPNPITLGPAPASGERGPVATLQGNSRLLSLTNETPVLPTDYDIGPLQDSAAEDAEVGDIYATVSGFFGKFGGGKVDTTFVSPNEREILPRFLGSAIQAGTLPVSVRIGAIVVEGDQAHAPIRLIADTGRADGEVYAERIAETWYISDIQIDFSDLAKPYKRAEDYEPTTWQWQLRR